MNFLQNSTKYILGTAEMTENDVQSPPFVQGLLPQKRTYLCRTRGVDRGDIILLNINFIIVVVVQRFYHNVICCVLFCMMLFGADWIFWHLSCYQTRLHKTRHTCFRKIKRPKSKLKIKTLMTHQCWRLKILECATVSCMLPVK